MTKETTVTIEPWVKEIIKGPLFVAPFCLDTNTLKEVDLSNKQLLSQVAKKLASRGFKRRGKLYVKDHLYVEITVMRLFEGNRLIFIQIGDKSTGKTKNLELDETDLSKIDDMILEPT